MSKKVRNITEFIQIHTESQVGALYLGQDQSFIQE